MEEKIKIPKQGNHPEGDKRGSISVLEARKYCICSALLYCICNALRITDNLMAIIRTLLVTFSIVSGGAQWTLSFSIKHLDYFDNIRLLSRWVVDTDQSALDSQKETLLD